MSDGESELLRSTALKNALSILQARERAEQALLDTQQQLRESQERLQAALSAAGTGTFRWHIDSNALDADASLERLFGLEGAQSLRNLDQFLDRVYAEDRGPVSEGWQRCRQVGTGFEAEFRIALPDGSLRWLSGKGRTFVDAGGGSLYVTGACIDISRVKRSEEDLRRSEAELRTMADSIPQLAWMAEPDGYIFWYNRGWYEYTGTTFEHMQGWGWQSVHHPEVLPRVMAGWGDSIRTGAPFEMEFPLRGADGTYRWFLTRVKPLHDADGRVLRWFGTNTDIDSERLARAEAERASAMKDNFLANLSHELRTPLTSILGWSQMLRRHAPEDAVDLRQGLDVIERNARAQTQLIEDLLDMSRIASGKVRLDVQPVTPVSFIEAALEMVGPAAEAKGIRLERFLDPGAGPVSGDPSRLQQVIWNLLSNAIKFTDKGGKVQVVLERVNSHIEISVADTGIGIASEALPHVFERFQQADASTTRQFGGLGLGLAIVKQLIELHGGSVRVKSPGLGQGATFIAQLPLTVVHRDLTGDRFHPRSPRAVSADAEVSDLSGLQVLVVDDEADSRELIRRLLADAGAEVHTAGSAAEALERIGQCRPDALVSDIGMPGTDGYTLLRQIRALDIERGGHVPAIALTAFARSEDRTRALRAGFQVHVAKPVEPAELIATVASVAGRTGAVT